MWSFILGMIFGSALGITVVCLCIAGDDDSDYYWDDDQDEEENHESN